MKSLSRRRGHIPKDPGTEIPDAGRVVSSVENSDDLGVENGKDQTVNWNSGIPVYATREIAEADEDCWLRHIGWPVRNKMLMTGCRVKV